MGSILPRKVVHCVTKQLVYKYYDTKDEAMEFNNFNIMCCLDYEELNLDVEVLTKDGWFVRTRCKYLNQDNVKCTENQAHMLMNTLKRIHKQDYVHSDIRRSNILLSSATDQAYFIDFDLCGKVNTNYPSGFNHYDIDERHEDACAFKKRQKSHDEYSLNIVLQNLGIK